MSSIINGALQRKRLVLPAEDMDIEYQFMTHTYTLRDSKVVYSKGNDYIIDAIRCALLIREEESLDKGADEVVSLKPVLTDPVFVQTKDDGYHRLLDVCEYGSVIPN